MSSSSPRRHVAAAVAAAGLLCAVAGAAAAAPALDSATDPYPGIHHEVWIDAAVPARIHLVRVDLSSSELTLFATAEDDRGQRTSAWAGAVGAQVAINGDAFAIAGYVPAGLAVGGGAAWSTTADDAVSGFVRFARVGERTEAAIVAPEQVIATSALPAGTQGVVSGRPLLVRAGQPVSSFDCADAIAMPCQRAPRSAVAVSADGNTLWLAVVDGWQQPSLGLTCAELASFLDARGAYDALALDGGGAATLVVTAEGGVVSAPSDGAERTVANHLGVHYGMLPQGQLVGFVRERDVFDPNANLDGVTVTLDDGRVDVTGTDGFYNFPGVTPRLACVTAVKAGYRTEHKCKQVVAGQVNYNSIAMYPGDEVPDAGVPDAAVPDAAAGPDAARGDAGVADPDAGDGGGGGGGCAVTAAGGDAGAGGLATWLLATIAVLGLRRPRRPRDGRGGPPGAGRA
ncbi:MAG: phosphodiester glycosidase family protein [Kofleriaceae bacterium]|nr:phosphodiester glycosidase family protein [Kofleriaceae bacterium]MCB9573416.1 phosphodiester glycosidase family protein [Kofleriaceae bacterium]